MEVTTSDLPGLVGKVLVVQVVVDSDDEDYREITGRCLVAAATGLVIQTKSRSEIINMDDVIDIILEQKARRLSRRKLGVIPDDAVRQHLLDRHGMPLDLVKKLDVAAAVEIHSKVDHSKLGHVHHVKLASDAAQAEEGKSHED